jgi:nucleoside-diphosphate-sugar epimerase
MARYLVTGGAGFFGSIMKRLLLDCGHYVDSIDLQPDTFTHSRFCAYQGDINDSLLMESMFGKSHYDGVFHFAALLAHVKKDIPRLWKANVDGTLSVLKFCELHGVEHLVFTSSNCLWAKNFDGLVGEDEPPAPIEIYGKSKLEAERILLSSKKVASVIFRCPTIMDEGRLGLLGILFAFIDEGRRLPVVGDGENRYQFVYAKDLAEACLKAINYGHTDVFNIGSDNVKSFNHVYQYVIDASGSSSRIVHIPRRMAVLGMKLCYALGISPLGPYQYKMITSNFVFDTSKIKKTLCWSPTKTNEEMLLAAYDYYHRNKEEIFSRKNVSAHSSVAKMGIIRLVKWLS